ncbi:hypothetical protein [Natranaeroarchaeum sulfidigenes]|uniref:Uncharacterized protein n=1 Tax=Natranaeroarchaeum sulfidigenes TaxID=2784880 RepID=A0A897MUT4_9EURY|nr:hypothetical protein [Natranaeroarchaeum sulfidigenes]QSG02803.1 hypothetical protein AArcS_1592 [Natranaeroarchaeum sulfidigenes]
MTDGHSGANDDDTTDADEEFDELAEPVDTIMPVGNGSNETAAADDEQDEGADPSTEQDELDELDESDELNELDELAPPVSEIMPVGSREKAADESEPSDTDGGTDD